MTLATSGRIGSASSESAILQQYLESKLIEQLDTAGSILFNLTWKQKITPLGRQYLERAASGLRKEDRGFTSWPAPNTPSGGPNTKSTATHTGGMDLEGAVLLASWAQPAGRDWRDGRASQATMERNSRPLNEQAVMLAAWNSLAASDGNGGKRPHPDTSITGRHPEGRKVNMGLASQVHVGLDLTGPARLTASGEMLTGSDAQMASSGQLNPAHSRWLQGLPPEFCASACMAMLSFPKSPRRSSKLTQVK